MLEEFKFKGVARLENAVNFASTFSPDGEVVILTFDDLIQAALNEAALPSTYYFAAQIFQQLGWSKNSEIQDNWAV